MDVSPNALRKATVETLREIEAVIDSVKKEAESNDIKVEDMKDYANNRTIAPLLLAKAQCLTTLTELNEQGKPSRGTLRR